MRRHLYMVLNNDSSSGKLKANQSIASENDDGKVNRSSLMTVAIGASAGGHHPLETILHGIPCDTGLSFVVILHIPETGPSHLDELIRRYTSMSVLTADDGVLVQPNVVYVIPPGKDMTVREGRLRLHTIEKKESHHPIDIFLTSLAADFGERAVAVILSGFGLDGSEGVKRIKEGGGIVLVQEPSTAVNTPMPKNAIATGTADMVLSPEEIANILVKIANEDLQLHRPTGIISDLDENLQNLLVLLQSKTGHDFSSYKKNTVLRRIDRRMKIKEVEEFKDYIAILEKDTLEAQALSRELLIGVTSFFRDPEAFDFLKEKIVPQLFIHHNPETPVRIWHACCATGEEVFSVAMLIQEYLAKENLRTKVQIFATDLDEVAIDQARVGLYPGEIESIIDDGLLAKYFRKTDDGRWQVVKQLREMVVFAQHSIIKDPPFSRLDLLVCRNFLIYLNPDIQRRLILLFHQVLNPGGFLFLGSAEAVGPGSEFFAPVDKRWKIFTRQEGEYRIYTPFAFSTSTPRLAGTGSSGGLSDRHRQTPIALAEKFLMDRYVPAWVVVNEKHEVVYFSSQAGTYLLPPEGEPTRDLLKMALEDLRPALRVAIFKALSTKNENIFRGVRHSVGGKEVSIDIVVTFIKTHPPGDKLVLVIFEPAPAPSTTPLPEELENPVDESTREALIRHLEEQLQITNEHLQATHEQLEASNDGFLLTNEELMATNEELQSANEELQATNEELETSKEELQTLNEELITVNAELQGKMEELNQSNSDLENLFASSEIATLFLDKKLTIMRFSPAMAQIFSLISADIGRPFRHFSGIIDMSNLAMDASLVLEKPMPIEREVTALEDDRSFIMRILPYRTGQGIIDGIVVTLLDISQRKRMEKALRESENRLGFFIDQAPASLAMFDTNMRYLRASKRWLSDYGLGDRDLTGLCHYDVFPEIPEEWREAHRRGLAGEVLRADADCFKRADGSEQWIRWEIQPWVDFEDNIGGIVIFTEDITNIKKAEEVLKRYELLAEQSRDIILFVRQDDGRILDANAAALSAYGYHREDLPNLSIRDLRAPGTHALTAIQMAEADAQGILFETVHRRNDGTIFPVEVSSQGADLGGIRVLLSVVRDISERKQAEDTIKQASEMRRMVLEAADLGAWHYNFDTDEIYCDPKCRELWGFPEKGKIDRAMVIGRIHPEDRVVVEAAVHKALSAIDGSSFQCEFRVVWQDGTENWLASSGRIYMEGEGEIRAPARFVGISRDITQEKHSKVIQSRLAAIVESSDDAIIAKDLHGVITSWNTGAERIFGYRSQEILGNPITMIIPSDRYDEENRILERLCAGERLNHFETVRITKDGRRLDVSLTVSPIKDSQGTIIGISKIARDITELKQNQEQRLKLETQLQQVQKMEAVGNLAGGVAHDFNNMLGVILGHAEMALEEIDPNHAVYSDLQEITNAAQRSADITRQLLAFARKQTIVPKVIDLNSTVEQMLKMLKRLIGEDIDLIWQPVSGPWLVKIDPTQVDQILANLCVNARDAIHGTGTIVVKTENSTLDKRYCENKMEFSPGEYVMLTVSDTGCGIDEHTLTHIFEPFYTTKNLGEGTGLGLATVYGIVKQNNGSVEVFSEPGKGTTFRVYLPRFSQMTGALPTNDGTNTAKRGQETILLVEDEPKIMRMTSIMLQRLGYSVLAANSPKEAIKLVEEFGEKIDLLITDVIMPGMNGKELAHKLLQKQTDMKCLFMSGYTADIINKQGKLEAGMSFLQKPFSRNELASKVRTTLDGLEGKTF